MGEQIPINPGLRGVFGLDDEHVVAGQDTRNENGSNRFPYLLFIHPIIHWIYHLIVLSPLILTQF